MSRCRRVEVSRSGNLMFIYFDVSTFQLFHSFTHSPIHSSTHQPINSKLFFLLFTFFFFLVTHPLIYPSTHLPINSKLFFYSSLVTDHFVTDFAECCKLLPHPPIYSLLTIHLLFSLFKIKRRFESGPMITAFSRGTGSTIRRSV